jgi:hypothetical protein
MKEIGGFFELELDRGREFHERAFALNSARNCLRYIVRKKVIKRLLVPIYTCEAVIDALQAEAVEIISYNIKDDFFPILGDHQKDYLLYINYFGINSKNIGKLQKIHQKLIIDDSQAFYSQPISNIDTFYSPRKFFGVPDGGYVYSSGKYEKKNFEISVSYDRFEHLIKRIDLTASDSYSAFKKAEETINSDPIKKMSNLTKALLKSIKYEEVRAKRLENFTYLHRALKEKNELSISLGADDVPMVYPFLTRNPTLRESLIRRSIYIATYWPDPKKRIPTGSWEAHLVSNLIPIPIDQRYGKDDIDAIVAVVMDNLHI